MMSFVTLIVNSILNYVSYWTGFFWGDGINLNFRQLSLLNILETDKLGGGDPHVSFYPLESCLVIFPHILDYNYIKFYKA